MPYVDSPQVMEELDGRDFRKIRNFARMVEASASRHAAELMSERPPPQSSIAGAARGQPPPTARPTTPRAAGAAAAQRPSPKSAPPPPPPEAAAPAPLVAPSAAAAAAEPLPPPPPPPPIVLTDEDAAADLIAYEPGLDDGVKQQLVMWIWDNRIPARGVTAQFVGLLAGLNVDEQYGVRL